MESTTVIVKCLLRDLGTAREAIRYIDTKLTNEAQGYYAAARAELVKLVPPTDFEARWGDRPLMLEMLHAERQGLQTSDRIANILERTK